MIVTLKHILVPVDFSVHSDQAVRYASGLASHFGACVELLHVVEDPMGTHGRSGLAHVFMGSVAERVVRRAPCPVITLRDTSAETSTAAKAVA